MVIKSFLIRVVIGQRRLREKRETEPYRYCHIKTQPERTSPKEKQDKNLNMECTETNLTLETNSTSPSNEGFILASMDTIKIGIYFFTWIFGLGANFLGSIGCTLLRKGPINAFTRSYFFRINNWSYREAMYNHQIILIYNQLKPRLALLFILNKFKSPYFF